MMKDAAHQEVRRRMTYTPVSVETQTKMAEVREQFITLAHEMVRVLPDGREQSMCLTNIELALRDAMAALHHGGPTP